MHELHLVETQPLSQNWRQTLNQVRYNSSQTIIIAQTVYQVSDCRPYFTSYLHNWYLRL